MGARASVMDPNNLDLSNKLKTAAYSTVKSKTPFTVEGIFFKFGSSKVVKHEKSCCDNQHAYMSFVFDTFAFLSPDALDLLHRD